MELSISLLYNDFTFECARNFFNHSFLTKENEGGIGYYFSRKDFRTLLEIEDDYERQLYLDEHSYDIDFKIE